MRTITATARILLAVIATIPVAASAQQYPSYGNGDMLIAPRTTAISVEEPRAFSPGATLEARPLSSTYQPVTNYPPQPAPQHRIQPPVNFRLASAEEAVKPEPSKQPLRLSPRSESARQPAARPIPQSPTSAISTVAGSLGVVLGLFLVIVWCTRKLTPSGAALLPKEAVELLGRAPLAGRQQMQLVRIGNKLVLLAISPVGAEALAEVTDATEVEHLTALCRRGTPNSSSAAFRDALTQLGNEPAERGFIGSARTGSRGTQ